MPWYSPAIPAPSRSAFRLWFAGRLRSAHKARRFRARNRRSPVGGVPTRLRARSRLRRAKNGSKLPIPGRRAGGGHAQRHTGPWRSRPPCLPGEPGICAGPAAPQRLPQPASAGLVRGRGRRARSRGLDPAFTPGRRRTPRPSSPLPCLGSPLQRAGGVQLLAPSPRQLAEEHSVEAGLAGRLKYLVFLKRRSI